jgi:hypothetical protein
MVNFLPPMSVAIRVRGSWPALSKRGEVLHLKAAMLLADLRGFSRQRRLISSPTLQRVVRV